jgi:hypothetical protein
MHHTELVFTINLLIWSFCYRPLMAALSLHASVRNKIPITDVLKPLILQNRIRNCLEIASGTGEHAAFFMENIPDIIIQPTEYVKVKLFVKDMIMF